MSKVLIDRALLERVQERLDPHRDAVLWGDVCDTFRSAPSGTPAMPVKAYYHEWTDLEGVRTRSVGLEVRKEFTDAPLVLEADALARIACLEGEIAKRDARIVELEADLAGTQSRVLVLQDQWRQIDAELAAIKAQEPVCYTTQGMLNIARENWNGVQRIGAHVKKDHRFDIPLYAAPVSEAKAQGEHGDAYQGAREDLAIWKRRALEAEEKVRHQEQIIDRMGEDLNAINGPTFMGEPVLPAKAQGVVMPERKPKAISNKFDLFYNDAWNACLDEVARLNAAPVQQVSVPDGWMLVPVEPTHEMLGAALMNQVECLDAIEVIRTDYKAMLAAAPAPRGE